jgi:biotin--protein ligase
MTGRDVVVYHGKGTMLDFLTQFLHEEIDRSRHGLRFVSAEDVRSGRAFDNAGLLIMPGGEDRHFCADLNGAGNRNITEFLYHGGYSIKLCGSAYYSMSRICYNKGLQNAVSAPRELALVKGTARGSIPQFAAPFDNTHDSAAIVPVELGSGTAVNFYYNGGPYFEIEDDPFATVAGRYQSLAGKPPAIIEAQVGQGHATLLGVHPEVSAARLLHHIENDPRRARYMPMVAALQKTDRQRQKFITDLFNGYGVSLRPSAPNPAVAHGTSWLTAPRRRFGHVAVPL